MRTIIVVVSVALAAAIGACGNDPRLVDAPVGGADGSAQLTCKNGSAYLMDCNNPSTCMGCQCVAFGHALYCSPTCNTIADCPPPAVACNGGFCMR